LRRQTTILALFFYITHSLPAVPSLFTLLLLILLK
jgi:hypothetical protein